MIPASKLIRAIPHASEPWLIAMVATMPKFSIIGYQREAMFLAQIRHECADFSHFEESLYYTDPERIAKIFRTAFDENHDRVISQVEIDFAAGYARNPRKLANRAYAFKYGNGNEDSGDGYKYRGRGPIQTTFKDNYRMASEWANSDLVTNPDQLLIPDIGCAAACGYWRSHGCNELADVGDIRGVTKQINPGLAGLEERTLLTKQTRDILEAT